MVGKGGVRIQTQVSLTPEILFSIAKLQSPHRPGVF